MDDLPLLPPVQLGPGVQRTSEVVNVVETQPFSYNAVRL